MVEEPKNDPWEQLLPVAESIGKDAETISAPEDPKGDELAVPETFLCPPSNVLMADPVTLSSGHNESKTVSMVEDPKNDPGDQLVAVAESVERVAAAISDPKDLKGDEVAVPEKFLCPLSKVLMTDPVMLSTGHTFDRSAIEKLLEEGLKICPMTKQHLAHSNLMPNHLARAIIHDWCKEYFESLHKKLSSESPSDQKAAAKELRKEATEKSYFRKLYAEKPDAIPQLLAPLSKTDGNSKLDPEIQEDLITVLMIISGNERVRKVIAESPEGVRFLVDALRSENVATKRNAASTFSQFSSIDWNKEITGTKEAIVEMATLLTEEKGALLLKDICIALNRLLLNNNKNKKIAVKHGVVAAIFQKIQDNKCVDIMLPILANLSTVEEGVNQMENFSCEHLLRVIRESLSDQDKENGVMIVSNALTKNESKWTEMVISHEFDNHTISDILKNGNLRAKKLAGAILGELLKKLL